ncbi:MAG: alpha-amylase family glycosyl hydrolase [Saprospiraceae bacterium]|nr:alpha-amylase family glycosyl hydrolase [Saprospiraceae bacterium]
MKLQFHITILFLVFCNISLSAQVVYTDPYFPKLNQAVTIYFDATQGSGGLKDCNCDVYLHTGVITNASTSQSDWKNVVTTWGQANAAWKMTKVSGQSNLYSYTISPSIRQYYGIGTGVIVQNMAFVFRNANGSKEGKDVGNKDILYPIYADNLPFTGLLINPTNQALVKAIGETIPIRFVTSENATITLTDNGNQLTQVNGTLLNYTLQVNSTGTHTVAVQATAGQNMQTATFSYAVPSNIPPADPPIGTQAGFTFLENDTKLRLALYAPGKNHVFVIGDFNDWKPNTDFQMTKSVDGNTFWIEIEGLTPGENYTYQYLINGELRIADPYSTLILDSDDDPFIPVETYPNLPAYPKDKTTGNVTLLQPGAPDYQWQTNNFQRSSKENLVIYELLLRDFLARHDYQTLIDTLNYLERLGINAIELMPINEFEGNISWGYNPSYHMALDKYYGPINEFQRFVDECHSRGIAVILDVVFNHAFGQSPLAQLYWDAANNRPAANNPWLNPIAKHPFNVGFDFNHESAATRAYVDRCLRYWLSEFRVDGFRFDLSKGFTQKTTNDDSQFRLYDAGRIATLKHYADVVWSTAPGAYVILEHFAENSEEIELSNYGMMLWGGFNIHNNYLEAAMGYTSNFSDASYKSRGWSQPSLIAYIESHDEERLLYKAKQFGNTAGSYNIKNIPTALRRAELANAFFYTIPGPKMLWQFGELGYDFPINYCPNGTSSEGCRVDPKPIRWDYFSNADRRRLYDVTSDLIYLKTNYEAFSTSDFTLNTANAPKVIHLNHATMDVAVQGNFGVADAQIVNPFQHGGWWYEYFTGDSILVNNPSQSLSFAPGEYRLYTTKKIARPSNMTTSAYEIVKNEFNLSIAPNPTNGVAQVQYNLEESASVKLEVFNLLGQRLQMLANTLQMAGIHQYQVKGLVPGMYLIKLTVGNKIETKQLSVVK